MIHRVVRPKRFDHGFSLVEVVVALVVLCVGILAVFESMATMNRQKAKSSILNTTTVLAQEKMEQWKAADFASIVDQTEDFKSIAGYPNYKRTTEVTEDKSTGLKTVSVTVMPGNGGKEYQLDFLMGPPL